MIYGPAAAHHSCQPAWEERHPLPAGRAVASLHPLSALPPAPCRKLRSVEAAAHLLQSFKRIQTQGAIQRQMAQKLADVLDHFVKEVGRGRHRVGQSAPGWRTGLAGAHLHHEGTELSGLGMRPGQRRGMQQLGGAIPCAATWQAQPPSRHSLHLLAAPLAAPPAGGGGAPRVRGQQGQPAHHAQHAAGGGGHPVRPGRGAVVASAGCGSRRLQGGLGSDAAAFCYEPWERTSSLVHKLQLRIFPLRAPAQTAARTLRCRWARGLFGKIRRTMATLQGLEPELEASEAGARAVAACKGACAWGGALRTCI